MRTVGGETDGLGTLGSRARLREVVQVVGVKNVMRKELSVEVYGLDEFRQLDGPALIVANHASFGHGRAAVDLADQTPSPHCGGD